MSSGSLGFKLGDNEQRLHPFVDVDTHWVTNPGRLDVGGVSDVENTARLGFDLKYPSNVVELTGNGAIAYNKYWGIQNPSTADFSSAAGHLAVDALFNKEGMLTLRLSEFFLRSADPANQTYTERLQHIVEQASASLDIKPGGGALMLTLGYGIFYDRYDPRNPGVGAVGSVANSLDNFRQLPELRLSWKFLPKTALFIEAQAQLTDYLGATQPGLNIDSRMLMASAGLGGNLTHKLAVILKGGYGNSFMVSGSDNLQTWVGQAELAYDFSETSKFKVGALRTIQPTSLFRYFTLSKAYITFDQQLASGTQISLTPHYDIYDYGSETVQVVPGQTQNARHDTDWVVDVTLAQRVVDWFTIAVVDRFDRRTSNFTTAVGNAGYLFNDVYLRLDLRY